jgi:hypothetical protein
MSQAKRKTPLRATPERWTFRVVTNDGKTRIESKGSIDPSLGEALRVLQIHIAHLSWSEQDMLRVLTSHVRDRMKGKATE